MAKEFLAATQSTSDIIEPRDLPAGMLIIAFFGTMATGEKWQIELADVNADPPVWVATHRTDDMGLTTADALLRWGGPRDLNRVFEIPVSTGYRYRARKVLPATANTTVTAVYSEGTTKSWI